MVSARVSWNRQAEVFYWPSGRLKYGKQEDLHKLSTDFFAARMSSQLSSYLCVQFVHARVTVRRHIEPRKLGIFLKMLFLISPVLKNRLKPFTLFSLGHLKRTCVWGATWTVCKLSWTWESSRQKWNEIDEQTNKQGYFAARKAREPTQHILKS